MSIQNSHIIATDGYRQGSIRSEYEYVLANRTSDMFAYTAKKNGKVISKTSNGIIVEYEDGERKGITLGRVYGKAEGSVYPHDIVTNLSENDTVVKGTMIAYNKGFFEQDILDPTNVIFKKSMNVKVALLESNQTFEDSSSISSSISSQLRASTTKVKSIVVKFNQNLIDIVKVNQEIFPNDVLVIIEDEITSTTSVFDEESLAVLKRLSNQAPVSKYEGNIDKIEVLYHGDKQDMSPTIKSLADKSDKLLADICRSSGKPVITGRVNDEYRVGGNPLTIDTAEIKFYITIKTDTGTGDKIIFGNQLKSVIGEVMDYKVTTESGEDIQAIFGFRSILARIVESPVIMGTTTTLLKIIAAKAVEIYNKE